MVEEEPPKISEELDVLGFIAMSLTPAEAKKLARAVRKQREAQMPRRTPTPESFETELRYLESLKRK